MMPAQPQVQFGSSEVSCLLRLIELAYSEDLAQAGDITSQALVDKSMKGHASLVARQAGVVAGIESARIVFQRFDNNLSLEAYVSDGTHLKPSQSLARITGSMCGLLAAERLALNFLQRLSGIATLTRQYVDAVAGLPCLIYDTRKTTPGWRALEKYAVRAGGGHNHRSGLHDAVLIKDNHLIAWTQQTARQRSLADALCAARQAVPPGTVIELEVDSLELFQEAIAGDPDIVLLDNMPPEQLRQAVAIRNRSRPGLVLEASGGITLQTIRSVAETGVDRISVGAVTHSPPALDIALDFEEPEG